MRRHFAGLGAALAVVVGLAAPASAQPAPAPFVLGSASASAVVTKARLFYAGFSLVVPLGLSAATYENKQSRALGSAYDASAVFGLVDQHPPQFGPIAIDSNKGDATKTTDIGAGSVAGKIDLTARAVPRSTSEVRLADVDVPGALRVEGGHTSASAAVVEGNTRRAEASVSIASVSLAGGLVTLADMRWDAIHRSGASKQADATFTLGALFVAGIPVATDVHDIAPLLVSVNTLLAPTGLVVEAPQVIHRDNGGVDVTALRVGVINSPLGAEYVGPTIAQLRPALLPLFDALVTADPTLGLAALVADLGLGVADGSGGLEFSVGGAGARTDDQVFANALDGFDVAPPALATGDIATPPTLVAPSQALDVPGTLGETRRLAGSEGFAKCVLAAGARRNGNCRGTNVPGAIAVVALVIAAIATYESIVRRRAPSR